MMRRRPPLDWWGVPGSLARGTGCGLAIGFVVLILPLLIIAVVGYVLGVTHGG
jgi:hypothetical protein